MTVESAPDKVQTSIRIEPELYKWLREFAFGSGWSQSFVVEQGLRLFKAVQSADPNEFLAILREWADDDAAFEAEVKRLV